MLSITKTITALLASALLCTSPLAAALKTKSEPSSVRPRSASTASHLKSSSSRTSSHAAAHNSFRSAQHSTRQHGKVRVATSSKPKLRGQQSIDPARTIQIQQALIRQHYLNGEATGEWDQATRDALIKFQDDNHWQTKIVPDSRALIKLGLGPSQQNLLNPETAAIALPQSGVEKSAPGGSN